MKNALHALGEQHPGPWRTIIWVGPGYGSMLSHVRQMDAERIVMLEPHPELHARLDRRLGGAHRDDLSSHALWSSDGTYRFHLLSDPLRSTLCDPRTVIGARPNLRVESTIDVDVETLETLANRHGLSADEHNLLILDATGAEDEILGNATVQSLAPFSYVLYARAPAAAVDAARLPPAARAAGFSDLVPVQRSPGVEWILWRRETAADAARHPGGVTALRAELARLQVEAAQHVQAREAADAQAAQLDADVARLAAERDAIAATAAQAAQARDAAQAEAARLAGDAAALRQQLDAKLEEVARHVLEREAADARCTDSASEAASLQQQVVALRDEAARVAEANAQQVAELQGQLREARQTANLAAKLQTLREADLADLQQRYVQSRDVQAHQHELLMKVGERLGTAASYFQQLSSERVAGGETSLVLQAGVPDPGGGGPGIVVPDQAGAAKPRRTAPKAGTTAPGKRTGGK